MFEMMLGVGDNKHFSNSWETLAYPFNGPYDSGILVAVGEFIYAYSGNVNSTVVDTMWRFNTLDGTWLKMATGPKGGSGVFGAAVNGKIYYFAGFNAGYLDTIRCYDIATDTWTTKVSKAPDYRINGSACMALGDKIYFYGGRGSSNPIGNTWMYDPVTDVSTYLATRPYGISKDVYFSLDGINIVSAMGTDSTNAETMSVYVFNINTLKWTPGDPATTGRLCSGAKAGVINNVAYYFGGYPFTSEMWCYDGNGRKWVTTTSIGTKPTGVQEAGCVAVGGSYYVLGGQGPTGGTNVFRKYTPPE